MNEEEPGPTRQEQIVSALLKVLAVALVVGALFAIGFLALYKGAGLGDVGDAGKPIEVQPKTPNVLPTTALPSPTGSPTGTPTGSPTDDFTDPGVPTQSLTPVPGSGSLFLNASPLFVKPMERINLTGQWPGRDNVSLLVQRKEGGKWVDFGVQTQVDVGTFATYVLTGHTGDNEFRVFDPDSETASNSVVVTIQG
ncbi:MAG: hypothetical protein ACJ72E_08285 [Marmoricola sp.]